MTTAKGAAREAKSSDGFRRTARVGHAVIGLMHIIIGSVAVSIAVGAGGDADQDGAMEQIRSTPIGGAVLATIGVGLIALVVWQIASGMLARGDNAAKKWGQRVKFFGIAAAYLVIAGMALVYAFGGSADSEQASKTFSAIVLSAPGGAVLLILVGLGVVGVGIGFLVIGVTGGFEKTLDLPGGGARGWVLPLGVAGYLAKGVAVGVTGVLFVVAAWTQDPEKAAGLDAALRSLLDLPYGPAILWVVGVGLVIYGVFCLVRARFAKM